MVVVAIIGLLVAIAIPQYGRFQKRATQTEAKTALTGLYVAQKTFITEWKYGSSDMVQLGFAMEGADPVYAVGYQDRAGGARDASAVTPPAGYRGPVRPGTHTPNVGKDNGWHSGITNTSNTVKPSLPCSGTFANQAACQAGDRSTCSWASGACTGTYRSGGLSIGTTGTQISFSVGAVGYLGIKASPAQADHDVWVINHEKRVTNSQDGLDK